LTALQHGASRRHLQEGVIGQRHHKVAGGIPEKERAEGEGSRVEG